MNKEELEKEAVEYCANNCGDCYGCHKKYRKSKNCEKIKSMIKTYLTSAEPREKRIEELKTTNKRISDECHKLVDTLEKKQKEVAELQHKIDILQGYLDRDVEYQELQEENAELKALRKNASLMLAISAKKSKQKTILLKQKIYC